MNSINIPSSWRAPCLAMLIGLLGVFETHGQGYLIFSNIGYHLDFPVYDRCGLLASEDWSGQFWMRQNEDADALFEPLSDITTFTPKHPGYMIPGNLIYIKPSKVPSPDKVFLELRIWHNEGGLIDSFDNATLKAKTEAFQLKTNASWRPLASPPVPPSYIHSLGKVPRLVAPWGDCEPAVLNHDYEFSFKKSSQVFVEQDGEIYLFFRKSILRSPTIPPPNGPEFEIELESVTALEGVHFRLADNAVSQTYPSVGFIHVQLMDNPDFEGNLTFRVHMKHPRSDVKFGDIPSMEIIIQENDNAASSHRGIQGEIQSFAATKAGKWMIGGAFTSVDGHPRRGVARIEHDGLLDPAFDPGKGVDGRVMSILEDNVGGYVLGGSVVAFDGQYRQGMFRLHSNGTLDNAFVPGWQLDSISNEKAVPTVQVIAPAEDGAWFVGGRHLGGERFGPVGLVRLHKDGRFDTSFAAPLDMTSIRRILPLQNGGLIALGDSDLDARRLLPTGLVDEKFQVKFESLLNDHFLKIHDFLELNDGELLIGGVPKNSNNTVGLLAIDKNGDLRGEQASLPPSWSGTVTHMVLQHGKPLIHGNFTRKETSAVSFMRLSPRFQWDPSLRLMWHSGPMGIALGNDGCFAAIGLSGRHLTVYAEDGRPFKSTWIDNIVMGPDQALHMSVRSYQSVRSIWQSKDLVRWRRLNTDEKPLQGGLLTVPHDTSIPTQFFRASSK